MILLRQQDVDELRGKGRLVIVRAKDGFRWRPGRVYQVKTWIYAKKAVAHAAVEQAADRGEAWEITLALRTVFDYVKQKHGSVPQMEIEL